MITVIFERARERQRKAILFICGRVIVIVCPLPFPHTHSRNPSKITAACSAHPFCRSTKVQERDKMLTLTKSAMPMATTISDRVGYQLNAI